MLPCARSLDLPASCRLIRAQRTRVELQPLFHSGRARRPERRPAVARLRHGSLRDDTSTAHAEFAQSYLHTTEPAQTYSATAIARKRNLGSLMKARTVSCGRGEAIGSRDEHRSVL